MERDRTRGQRATKIRAFPPRRMCSEFRACAEILLPALCLLPKLENTSSRKQWHWGGDLV